MKKGINILAGVVLLVSARVFLLSIVFRLTGIYINTTPSFPVGFYKIVDEPAGRGAYVSFCPPQDEVFDMAVARHTINTGNLFQARRKAKVAHPMRMTMRHIPQRLSASVGRVC